MTIKERLEYAQEKLNEAIENADMEIFKYWCGYRDAIKRVMEEQNEQKR